MNRFSSRMGAGRSSRSAGFNTASPRLRQCSKHESEIRFRNPILIRKACEAELRTAPRLPPGHVFRPFPPLFQINVCIMFASFSLIFLAFCNIFAFGTNAAPPDADFTAPDTDCAASVRDFHASDDRLAASGSDSAASDCYFAPSDADFAASDAYFAASDADFAASNAILLPLMPILLLLFQILVSDTDFRASAVDVDAHLTDFVTSDTDISAYDAAVAISILHLLL